jgi:hypothetical protein
MSGEKKKESLYCYSRNHQNIAMANTDKVKK